MSKIRIAVSGYGNLGRGVFAALRQNPDMEPVALFTRRDPASIPSPAEGVPVVSVSEMDQWTDKVDVLILCGGSATDLPKQGPEAAGFFNTVDSFDTHARIPEYFESVDSAAKAAGHLSLISVGWDPGLFSLMRVYGQGVLPEGESYTFWGRGVSQGHSDAIRRVPGVLAGIQYTVPRPEALKAVRAGENPELTTREKHTRECYVVAEEGADRAAIAKAITEMPNYFDEYDTTVNFISMEELKRDHAAMPHGGFVLRSGKSANGTPQLVEYSLKLGSNPEFTSSVLVAYARALFRMKEAGRTGAMTVLDVPPILLLPEDPAEVRAHLL